MMKTTKTERGFYRGQFTDRYGAQCSIQESSLATEAAIWLGVDEPEIHQEGWHPEYPGRARDLPKEERDRLGIRMVSGRMHLTQDMVRDLLPALQYFVEHGTLPAPLDEPSDPAQGEG